jgi:DNA-binding NtrC family response regulator
METTEILMKRLLVVDDEAAFLLALKKLLSTSELSIDTAETLEDTMLLLKQTKYDAVIADIRLTGVLRKEGITILSNIKKEKSDTKVIMMTGFGTSEIKQEAYDLGADFYFEKPVSIHILKNALQEMQIVDSGKY